MKKDEAKEKKKNRRIKQVTAVIVLLLTLLFSIHAQAASNTTIYSSTHGYYTLNIYYNNQLVESRQVHSDIGTDMGNSEGQSWCPTYIKDGSNYLKLKGTPYTSRDGAADDHAHGWYPWNRQYVLNFEFDLINIPDGYGFVDIVCSEHAQAWAWKTGEHSFTVVTDTNDNGMTNYGEFWGTEFHHSTFNIYIGPQTYTINFNPNGGTINSNSYPSGVDTTITYNTTDIYEGAYNWGAQAPSWASSSKTCRTGYTLDGWYDSSGTKVYNADCSKNLEASAYWNDSGQYVNAGNVNLTAHWNQNTYDCTFDANGGAIADEATNPVTFTYNSNANCLGQAPKVSRRGYNFIGWYGTADGGSKVFDTRGHWYNVDTNEAEWWGWQPDGNWYNGLRTAKWVCASDATVFAHWTPKTYNLYINPNGGTYNDTTDESTKTLKFDSSDNNYIGTPSRTGYTFKGWYTSATGGEAIWDVNGYAIQYQRHTTYWNNGRDWNANWMGGSLRDFDHMTWNYDGDIRVYAHWEPIKYNQTINYYAYEASGKYDSATHTWVKLGSKTWSVDYDSTFDAESHKADWGNVSGYHWWSIDDKSWKVSGARSTNSRYYPNTYRVNVDLNKGNGSTTPTGTKGNFDMEYKTYKDLGSPTRVGYTFAGWKTTVNNSTNSSLSKSKFTMGYSNTYPYKDYKEAASVKIAAQWNPIKYTIVYHGNGNWNTSQGDYTQELTYDTAANLIDTKFSRNDKTTYNNVYYAKGYEFVGWGTSPSQTTPTYTNKQQVNNLTTVNGDTINLYAIWKKTVTITFNFNGGKFSNSAASKVYDYTMYNNVYTHTFDIKSLYGTMSNGTAYNSKGTNTVLTKTDANSVNYRFIGYNTAANNTTPNKQYDVYAAKRAEKQTLRDNLTLYAIWEPVLEVNASMTTLNRPEAIVLNKDLDINTSLGKFTIKAGTNNTKLPNSINTKDYVSTIKSLATNGNEVKYSISAKGSGNIKYQMATDERILDIYRNGKDNTWYDTLNSKTAFSNTIEHFKSTSGSLIVPKYLGTKNSYWTSNPLYSEGTSVYALKFTCTQPSYYYNKYWDTDEQVTIYGLLFVSNMDPSTGKPKPDGDSSNDEIYTLDGVQTQLCE